MAALNISDQDLRAATREAFSAPGHAPQWVWVDHFDHEWSYVRATYPEEFCNTCCRRLLRLVELVKAASQNNPDVTVCVYVGNQPESVAADRQAFVRNRLAGITRRGP